MTVCRCFFNRSACHWVLLYALWEWGFWESGENIYLPCSSAETSHGSMEEHNANAKVDFFLVLICSTVQATWKNILENIARLLCLYLYTDRLHTHIFVYICTCIYTVCVCECVYYIYICMYIHTYNIIICINIYN